MSFFKEAYANEKEKEYNSVGLRSLRKNVRVLPQVKVQGVDKKIDASRKALMPGKRISAAGKVYWETRGDRSDSKGSNL